MYVTAVLTLWGTYGIAFVQLWDLCGPMGLHCCNYGDLWDCTCAASGSVLTSGDAVWHLWGSILWLAILFMGCLWD